MVVCVQRVGQALILSDSSGVSFDCHNMLCCAVLRHVPSPHTFFAFFCRRDAAEREAQEAAAAERERLKSMSEEERLAWLKANRPQVRC